MSISRRRRKYDDNIWKSRPGRRLWNAPGRRRSAVRNHDPRTLCIIRCEPLLRVGSAPTRDKAHEAAGSAAASQGVCASVQRHAMCAPDPVLHDRSEGRDLARREGRKVSRDELPANLYPPRHDRRLSCQAEYSPGWIRTNDRTDYESGALPLSYGAGCQGERQP